MKSLFLMFAALCVVFGGTWIAKANTPINRPETLTEDATTAWYESGNRTVATASDEWYIDPEIPVNYVPVPGEDEVYMVINDSGNITGYRKRVQQSDGSWLWTDVETENNEYTPVEGVENLYLVTNAEGNESYQLYVRNEDDNTYTFVNADANGTPYYNGTDASSIADNFERVTGNIFAVYNENGIKEGYAERVQGSDGNYFWQATQPPTNSSLNGIGSLSESQNANNSHTGEETANGNAGTGSVPEQSTTTNPDGTYTVTMTQTETKTVDGQSVMTETTYYYTYAQDGTLLSTRKGESQEISRTPLGSSAATPDPALIQNTLDAELARISAEVTFNTDKAQEVLAALNAQRISQGLGQLTMDTSSDAYKLACVRAADMAIYRNASTASTLYGSLDDMVERWGIQHTETPAENVWGTPTKSAAEIHSRFQSIDAMRMTRMSQDYTHVGIAVVDTADEQTYIAEIYLD